MPRPVATASPVTIQKRMTMVTCSQPSISKWWCRGVIRKTRWPAWTLKMLRNSPLARLTLKTDTWIITDSVMTTNSPPMTSSSSSVRVMIAKPAIAPPSDSEPVSPRMICAGDDGEVQRVTHLVALRARLEGAGLAVLPDVDQRVGREDEDARAGREAVEAVGQVHRVAEAGDDEPDEEQGQHGGEREPLVVADEGDVVRRRTPAALVLEHRREGEHSEHECDDRLADHLRAAAQAGAVLSADLEEVVEEADDAEPHQQEDQQQRRGGGRLTGDQLGREVADDGGQHDDRAAHGRRTALDVVGGRTVVADRLPESLPREEPDRVARAEQGDQQGESSSEQDGSHVVVPSLPLPVRRSSAISSSAAPRDAFTRTTSAAETLCRSQSTASSRPAVVMVTPPPAAPRKPREMSVASSPTASSTSTPTRAAYSPTPWWAAAAPSPSSSIWPSTATVRRPVRAPTPT